jgi:hypothetical protein
VNCETTKTSPPVARKERVTLLVFEDTKLLDLFLQGNRRPPRHQVSPHLVQPTLGKMHRPDVISPTIFADCDLGFCPPFE